MLRILKRNIKRLNKDITIIKFKIMKEEKKVRQYRSRQGRSDKQYSNNMKVMTYGCLGLGTMLIRIIIYCIITNG